MLSPACLAATRFGAAHGYLADDPVILQETNNTVVWLRPHAIIAKVGKWVHSEEGLLREHAVAVALTANDAPIAPPVAGIEPGYDSETGFLVTLWHRLGHDSEHEIDPTELAESLRQLHQGLARYEGELPNFRLGVLRARAALADDEQMEALPPDDRAMLLATFDRLLGEVEAHTFVEQTLHGEPHDGNLLATPSGLVWIDLEAACVGPLEWDLAFLPEEAIVGFPEADIELLRLLRTLNSARVASWCWLRAEIDEMRWHGEHHLEQVRLATRD